MRIIAPMMILIMMTSTLAGCTGGDPDGGGEIDTDALNDLIDQNLQDFINNTTITVNQENALLLQFLRDLPANITRLATIEKRCVSSI